MLKSIFDISLPMALRTGYMAVPSTCHEISATLITSYATVIAVYGNRAVSNNAPFAMTERTFATLFVIIIPIGIAITTGIATVVIATKGGIGGIVVLIGWRGRGCVRATTTA